MAHEVKRWQCDWCEYTDTREEIIAHEEHCDMNPAQRACGTCKRFFHSCHFDMRYMTDCSEWEAK